MLCPSSASLSHREILQAPKIVKLGNTLLLKEEYLLFPFILFQTSLGAAESHYLGVTFSTLVFSSSPMVVLLAVPPQDQPFSPLLASSFPWDQWQLPLHTWPLALPSLHVTHNCWAQ